MQIAPPPAARRWGTAAPHTTACARTLIANERSKSSGLASSTDPPICTPTFDQT